ncbi:MAG: flagellar basal-body MS-ring/collar protein FliF [Pseudomonadota bacterium]
MMQYFDKLKALSNRQRIIAGGGTLLGAVVISMMIRMAMTPPMALLYAGLDPAAAGEVITALEQDGVTYHVRGNSIYVPNTDRDTLRLRLAGQSLPSPSTEGYELLDRLDGFSTTSEMFSVTYWRAKEGELARTLMTIPGIRAARVHIGVGERGAFTRSRAKRTASVALTAPAGLEDAQVRAVRFMTALAVPNLQAADVAVIDTARGLLTSEESGLAAAGLNEQRRAQTLENDLLRLVEARVGLGNARVNVAIELGRRREEIAEHAIDPQSAVIANRTTQQSQSTENGGAQAVTVASDLPDGDDATAEQSAQSNESREEVAFAMSTTDRLIEVIPGGVERLSIAVLLDQKLDEEGTPIARAPEEIEDLRELVAAAAGINVERGDVVTIRSLPFERLVMDDAPPAGNLLSGLVSPRLIEFTVIGLTLLLFSLFVIRPVMKATPASGASQTALLTDTSGGTDLAAVDDPLTMLRDASSQRPDAAAALLNAWLEEEAA